MLHIVIYRKFSDDNEEKSGYDHNIKNFEAIKL